MTGQNLTVYLSFSQVKLQQKWNVQTFFWPRTEKNCSKLISKCCFLFASKRLDFLFLGTSCNHFLSPLTPPPSCSEKQTVQVLSNLCQNLTPVTSSVIVPALFSDHTWSDRLWLMKIPSPIGRSGGANSVTTCRADVAEEKIPRGGWVD